MIARIVNSAKFRMRHQLRRIRLGIKHGARSAALQDKVGHYRRFAGDLSSLIGPLLGKNVVEIGSDPKGSLLSVLYERGAAEVSGINPALCESSKIGSLSLIKSDGKSMPFPDSSVDLVVSISVLEHVGDLDQVLEEAFRVMVPGGYFYAEFGPIWSSVWGHHLWLYHGDEVVDWRSHPLPPYAHLLMTPVEMEQWCAMKFRDDALALKITEFVFQSPDQNRLFYSDYQECFQRSGFETLLLAGCPDLPPETMIGDTPICKQLEVLRRRYPNKSGYGYHVGRVLLRKP